MALDFDNSVFLSVHEVMGKRFSSLLDSYIKNTDKYMNDIVLSYKRGNLEAVKMAAHPLKSSSAALGFVKLSSIAEKIEKLSGEGANSKELKTLINDLSCNFQNVKEFISNNDTSLHNLDVSEKKIRTEDRIRVMHIDDDPVICKITRAYLCGTGLFYTKTFLSVDEAIASSQDFIPDIILVDFMMPDMEGIASLLNLKADPRLSNIPVVFVTGLGEEEVKTKLGSGIISGYLKKPYSAETLISLIKAHVLSKN